MKKFFLAVLAISVLLVGCGGKTPTETVKGFLDAGISGNLSKAQSYTTDEFALNISMSKDELTKEFARFKNYIIVKEEINDSKSKTNANVAKVTLKMANGRLNSFHLMQIDGQWKVYE